VSAYIARRLLQSLATLFLLSILFFLLLHLQPGGPCGASPSPATQGCIRTLHLDQPLANQYLAWVVGLLHGNFGTSAEGLPIGTLILQGFPPTALLVIVSLVVQQLIALPLGVLAALRPYSALDQTLTFLSYVALSLPSFVLGFALIDLFSVHLPWLPVGHYEDVSMPLLGSAAWLSLLWHDPGLVLGDLVRHLLLPVITITLAGIAIDSRFMRAAMLQILHEDYIRTARAKGIPRWRVVGKHALRNALLPIVTNLALYLPALISGVVVVEAVFTWGGLGYTYSQAITGASYGVSSDFTIIQSLSMLSAVAVIVANLLADLAYAWLDPRMREGRSGA
jgi:peptide/nickel transport system permease protein